MLLGQLKLLIYITRGETEAPEPGDADFGERLQALRSALAGVGE